MEQQDIQNIYEKEKNLSLVNELLDFGKQNGGWSELLSLQKIENIVFEIDNSWQEINSLITKRDILKSQDIKKTIKFINNNYEELKNLVESIYNILQELKQDENIKKPDAGMILKIFQKEDSLNNLPTETRENVLSLLILLMEFKNLHIKWVRAEGDFAKLLDLLSEYRESSLEKGNNFPPSNFPKNPGLINKDISNDGGWGWNRNRY